MSDEKTNIEVPEKFKSLVGEIEKMSVLDLAELVKVLEDKFGVSAAAPVAAMAMAPGAAAEVAEEKDSFDVELTTLGGDKIGAIKVIREVTELGLKEAKELVESAPKMVKEGANKETADGIKAKLEAVGCKVTLK
ncbi:MAG: 50S ribosomal protein L7/L12 [Patescibacteria group bacterium]